MRWDDLFADLENQFQAAQSAEAEADIAEQTRAARAGVELAARLRAVQGVRITIKTCDGLVIQGHVADAGATWLLLVDGANQCLIPMRAIVSVSGLTRMAAPPSTVLRRLGLGHVLRGLSRDRTLVVLHTDGEQLRGRIDAVYADHLDLAAELGIKAQAIPFSAITCVAAS